MARKRGRGYSKITNSEGNIVYEGDNLGRANKIWAGMMKSSFERWYGEPRQEGRGYLPSFFFGKTG